jgi:hypothetical protein
MTRRKILEIGGIAAGVLMLAFGIGSLVLSINARNTVSDELTQQFVVGTPDMKPSEIEQAVQEAGLTTVEIPSCDVAEKEIKTGADARCFAQYMRIHALESSSGLTYAQMGRFTAADDPGNPAGTNDATAAAKDESGKPIPNAARNTWVTETALATALNVSYMADRISLFGLVVGIALLISGIGFLILALAVFGGKARESER